MIIFDVKHSMAMKTLSPVDLKIVGTRTFSSLLDAVFGGQKRCPTCKKILFSYHQRVVSGTMFGTKPSSDSGS